MGRVISLENYLIPGAQGVVLPEGDGGISVEMGEENTVPGGVLDHGTQEEDGPATWETLAFPRVNRADGETGDPSPTPSA